jgi:hypothetical protein
MGLRYMLLKTAFLDEGAVTSRLRAFVVQNPGMLLEVIEHRVLAVRNLVTMRAGELAQLIADIL